MATPRVAHDRRRKSNPLSRVVQLRFTSEQYSHLETLAEAADVPVSQLIRVLVQTALLNPPDPADIPELDR